MQVRRLAAVLAILQLPVHALHAGMQQRQRLTALDRFRTNPQGVLVATDVAARGLDIPVGPKSHFHMVTRPVAPTVVPAGPMTYPRMVTRSCASPWMMCKS